MRDMLDSAGLQRVKILAKVKSLVVFRFGVCGMP